MAYQPRALAESLKVTGLTPTRANFQKILKMLAEKKRPELILGILDPVLNWSFQPDERDYTVGISVCGSQKLWQHACWLFSSMASAKIPVDVFACSATISACEKGGQWPQALTLFEAMPRLKVDRNLVSYNATISACAKAGEWKVALKLFDNMCEAKVKPDIVSHSAVISAYEKGASGNRH